MMKKLLTAATLSILIVHVTCAQQTTPGHSLGNAKSFAEKFINAIEKAERRMVSVALPNSKTVDVKVNVNNSTGDDYHIIGGVEGYPHSTIFFDGNDQKITGKIILINTKEAYSINTDDKGEVVITPTDITKIIGWDEYDFSKEQVAQGDKGEYTSEEIINAGKKMVIPQHESMPGAVGILYMDFDGEVSTSRWNGGQTINAVALNWEAQNPTYITNAWKITAEDYAPYQVNVTTIRARYDNAPKDQRMMCIYTTTKTAAPQFGGVAYINSFTDAYDDPCWAFFSQEFKGEAETGSHEFGHAVNLNHDGGSSNPSYYLGHGSWGPIMGASYGPTKRPISQFSKGEYEGATNSSEDDMERMRVCIKAGYKVDDHSNVITGATKLVTNGSGAVDSLKNTGIIEKRTDKDIFVFTTTGGDVKLDINSANDFLDHPNLDVQARLLDDKGTEILLSDPAGLKANITKTLAAGTYYIEVDGVGFANPLNTGYSDYGSLGYFDISGTYPEGTVSSVIINDIKDGIEVYPNPINDIVSIIFTSARNNEVNEVIVTNVLGEVIYSNNSISEAKISIDLHNQSNGIYFVRVKSGDQISAKKIVLSK